MVPGTLTTLRRDVASSELTSLGVGGPCAWVTDLVKPEDLDPILDWARSRELPIVFLGEGSNVVIADRGFAGLVIRTRILGRVRDGLDVEIGGGESLQSVIGWLNRLGLAGMERMYGIPGTVAGALVGNAGAYGQEIGELVRGVDVWTPGGFRTLSLQELGFSYRHSALKERRDWFLLRCRMRLRSSAEDLAGVSAEILSIRLAKYPVGLKCPGSFFKNVRVDDLSPESVERIPSEFIQHGKVPAGRLLEAVGANGARRGGAEIAAYHGNLFINSGAARADDLLALAAEYSGRVLERFGVRLVPEVGLIGFEPDCPED